MVMMMMTMMTTTMNRMSAVSCPVFLGEYSSTAHQVLVVWVFFCGSCLPELSIRWKFSGVCEKYEGWIFVEDDRGGLVMIRRELVRTRKCSSNLLFFTLVYLRYVSKPRYGSLAFPTTSVPACLHVPTSCLTYY